MIDHVYISVTDIEKSLAFYLEALKPLGWREIGNHNAAAGPAVSRTFTASATPHTSPAPESDRASGCASARSARQACT
jgi:catechol 2,3-dioxygenase-like lactoylglutathione lyase family enzyme